MSVTASNLVYSHTVVCRNALRHLYRDTLKRPDWVLLTISSACLPVILSLTPVKNQSRPGVGCKKEGKPYIGFGISTVFSERRLTTEL